MEAFQTPADAEDNSGLWTSFDIPPPQEPEPPSAPPPPAPAFVPPLPPGPPPQQLSVLHHELVALVKRLELTPREVQERQEAVGIIRDVAQEVWPYAQVIMFGSSATGLAHCGSDLDLVVCAGTETRRSRPPPAREWLSAMKGCLKGWQLCSKIETVPNAKVPIVKCVLHQPKLAVDIAFFVMNGPNAVPFIRQQVQTYAPLRDLCLVLKCLLGQNGLQEVYTGGIGSYCLLNMVVAHLQKTDPASQHDLGVLLLGFLRRYDILHNYATDVVAIKPGIRRNKDPNLLSVEDPQNPSQDIGKASFRIDDVRALFSRVRYALEAQWNRPGLIREIVDIDRDRMHLTDGPVLHKGNKKRKMGHARWQGAPGSPAEPPPNKKRKQNAPAASQKAPPLPPISAKKRKVAESSGLQSAWDLHPYNPTLHKSTEPQAKRSTVDRAVDNLLKPVRGAGTLDTWLSGGRAESSPGIGVLRDGIGGGTAVRVTPRQEERVSGPGGSGVNGHQTPSSGFANAGGGGFWAGLEGGAGVSVNGVNKPGSASQQGNNSLRLAGTVWRPCEGSFAEEPGLRAPLNGPAAPAEILTRGMVKDGGSPNPGPRLNGFRREYGAGNAEGGLKKLDEEGEGFVTRPLDGAGEGWVDGLPRDSRLSDEQRRLYGQPKTDIEVTGFEAAAVGTDGEGFPARNQSRETGHESATARTQTGGGEPWPGATVGPPAAEGKLRLPLRSDVMPASENRIMDEAVWERVVNGYGKRERVRVRKAEAFAALRAQRKQFLQRDATAQTLAELKLDPYAPRVREGFCQLARIMIRGGNEIGEVPAKAINAVRVWKDLSEKLFEGRTPVGGSPVTWLPKPIDELDETETKVLRKAVIKLAGGDGQDDAKAGHVAAGAGPQGGADVTREAGSGRKAKKKRKLELRKLEESGGVNGDARGAGGQSAGVTGPLLPTWQSQAFPSLGTEGPTVSGAEMGAHGQGGNGIGVDGHGLRAGRPDESLQRQHLLNGGGYASGVNGSGWGASEGGVNGRGAVEGSVNGAGLTGRNAYWGDGHQGSAGGTAANGGSQHWGPVTGAGANGNGVNGGVEHRVRLNGDSVHAGRFGDRDQKPKHEREPLQGGESAPNGHSHNSWGDSFGWQAPGSFPPGFGDRSAGPDARYKHPENHSRSGRPESPFVFSTTATSDADVAGGIWVNRSRLNGGLPAGFGQALGFDNAVRNHADGFGGRAGTGANGASPRRAGHDRGNSRRGNASQVPAFRGRSVVNVGQHVVGDALRY